MESVVKVPLDYLNHVFEGSRFLKNEYSQISSKSLKAPQGFWLWSLIDLNHTSSVLKWISTFSLRGANRFTTPLPNGTWLKPPWQTPNFYGGAALPAAPCFRKKKNLWGVRCLYHDAWALAVDISSEIQGSDSTERPCEFVSSDHPLQHQNKYVWKKHGSCPSYVITGKLLEFWSNQQ